MPWILPLFVPGFLDDPAKFDLTVLLTRICFPYLMCMSLMAAYAAILNGLGRFTASSFAPILLNIVMIAFMLPLVLYPNTDVQTAIWIAVGTIAGGIAQLGWSTRHPPGRDSCRNCNGRNSTAEVRRFWILAIPAVITGGITQINIFVGTIIASGAPTAPLPTSITPIASISCRSASSASPSAPCCCPSWRVTSRVAATRKPTPPRTSRC